MIELLNAQESLSFTQWTFPAGEVGVKIQDTDKVSELAYATIRWFVDLENNMHQEFFVVANLVNALRQLNPNILVDVEMRYVPYGRQDRVCHEGESFGLEVFMNLLTAMRVSVSSVEDPHSAVTTKLLVANGHYCTATPQHQLVKATVDIMQYDTLIAPDKGAVGKIKKLRHWNVVTLSKERTETGITYTNPELRNIFGKVLVVDDLCDAGGTFIALAKALDGKTYDISRLDLYVTHGLFTKGIEPLLEYYHNIYCFNLMNSKVEDSVITVPI